MLEMEMGLCHEEKKLGDDIVRYKERVSHLKRYWKDVDIEKFEEFIRNNRVEWNEMLSLLLGVKPCVGVGGYEAKSVKSFVDTFVPEEIKNKLIFSDKGWVADCSLVKEVILRYKEYFSDFDISLLDDEMYIRLYLNGRTTDVQPGVEKDEIIKTGLLLGYPIDSVVAFAKEGNKRGKGLVFNLNGFSFSSLPQDKKRFCAWLEFVYSKSGMKKLLNEYEEKMRRHFEKRVCDTVGSSREIEFEGARYIEVKSVRKRKGFVRQYAPLEFGKDGLTKEEQEKFIRMFSWRCHIEVLNPPKYFETEGHIEVGNNYYYLLKSLSNKGSTKKIPFIELVDYYKNRKIFYGFVRRESLTEFVNSMN